MTPFNIITTLCELLSFLMSLLSGLLDLIFFDLADFLASAEVFEEDDDEEEEEEEEDPPEENESEMLVLFRAAALPAYFLEVLKLRRMV